MAGYEKLRHKLLKDEIYKAFTHDVKDLDATKEHAYYNGERTIMEKKPDILMFILEVYREEFQ